MTMTETARKQETDSPSTPEEANEEVEMKKKKRQQRGLMNPDLQYQLQIRHLKETEKKEAAAKKEEESSKNINVCICTAMPRFPYGRKECFKIAAKLDLYLRN